MPIDSFCINFVLGIHVVGQKWLKDNRGILQVFDHKEIWKSIVIHWFTALICLQISMWLKTWKIEKYDNFKYMYFPTYFIDFWPTTWLTHIHKGSNYWLMQELSIGLCPVHVIKPGAVAWSEASSLGMQAAPSSIPTSGTFFRGDLVMKTFLRPFSLFRWFKKSSCQLLAKECALSTGKLPRRLAQEQCG